MFFFFILSGLFLGWSLGANDAANVYGTAVGTRMIKFRTAATVCSIFLILGAVQGGAGAAHTLGKLGSVNQLAGAFTVALAAAITVAWMTKLKLPVSTSQAIVGAIIGWNLFAGAQTDVGSLTKIVSSWVICPLLSAVFAILLFEVAEVGLRHLKVHLFHIDAWTRWGLFVVGAFASYSLGANNIANVMGVFVNSTPFGPISFYGLLTLSPAQQLFALGGVAIAVGVFTYSKKVMLTVGNDLFRMSPIAALVVVLAQAIVLFLFASEDLEAWLINHGLPSVPLVPVSSSQAVIGAVIGIGIAKGGRNIRFRVLGRIAVGWVTTPVISGFIGLVLLFIVQNVFSQHVHTPVPHLLDVEVVVKLKDKDLYSDALEDLLGRRFETAASLRRELAVRLPEDPRRGEILKYTEVASLTVDIEKLAPLDDGQWFSEEQLRTVFRLHGRTYMHPWQLRDALAERSTEWRLLADTKRNKRFNKELKAKLDYLAQVFAAEPPKSPSSR
ncbi:MAG: inorganic phosphate transporter [Pseudomonadota bacterium]